LLLVDGQARVVDSYWRPGGKGAGDVLATRQAEKAHQDKFAHLISFLSFPEVCGRVPSGPTGYYRSMPEEGMSRQAKITRKDLTGHLDDVNVGRVAVIGKVARRLQLYLSSREWLGASLVQVSGAC
jgi:hypothetical protein